MLNNQNIAVVLPAYNAERTLARTVAEIDRGVVDTVLVVDDASTDQTVDIARDLGLEPIIHPQNRGYGANQKTCYAAAAEYGADIVVMLHPDYQYSPLLVVPMAAMIAYDIYDCVLGSRILAQNAIAGGMPRYKYVANRSLTLLQNFMVNFKLSEYHTGLRAYRTTLLQSLPLNLNSDDFVFDNQILLQALVAGARLGEVSCPTRYLPESSSINFWRSVTYGIGVLHSSLQYRLHQAHKRSYDFLTVNPYHYNSPKPTQPYPNTFANGEE